MNAIKTGLKPGDKVVTDGQANLVDGAQVKVKEPGANRGDAAPSEGGSRRRRRGGADAQSDGTSTDKIPENPDRT